MNADSPVQTVLIRSIKHDIVSIGKWIVLG